MNDTFLHKNVIGYEAKHTFTFPKSGQSVLHLKHQESLILANHFRQVGLSCDYGHKNYVEMIGSWSNLLSLIYPILL